jgi:hypothetical protein
VIVPEGQPDSDGNSYEAWVWFDLRKENLPKLEIGNEIMLKIKGHGNYSGFINKIWRL